MLQVEKENRSRVSQLYLGYYSFWKLGDSISVICCMALTFYKHDAIQSVHNLDDLPMIFKEKFSYMAIAFGVISITCCALSVVVIFYGE